MPSSKTETLGNAMEWNNEVLIIESVKAKIYRKYMYLVSDATKKKKIRIEAEKRVPQKTEVEAERNQAKNEENMIKIYHLGSALESL